jgi:hypothetical protein
VKLKLNVEIEFDDKDVEYMLCDIPSSISYWGYLRKNDAGGYEIVDEERALPDEEPKVYLLPVDGVARGMTRLLERDPCYYRIH